MGGCSEWTFRGLTISPMFSGTYETVTLVNFNSRYGVGISREMVVEDCTMYSTLDTSGWTAADWVNACNGINLGLEGKWHIARNNVVKNVRFGITVAAEGSTAEYNQVINFAGDGINATNHGAVLQYNVIKNCYNVDGNHDDGIQGYLANVGFGQVRNVVLRGNVIINQEDPDQPFPGTLQGIGCFGGPYVDWLIENNVVMTNHWHGITLYQADGGTIVNNTIFSPWYYQSQANYETWMDVGRYYDAEQQAYGETPVVRNNIAHLFQLSGCDADHNIRITRAMNADAYFADWPNWDLRLADGSPAIDAGNPAGAPALDADELFRPIGLAPDVGAYEYGSLPPYQADAGEDRTLVDANGDGGELVTLDGTGSYSLAGEITSYLWLSSGGAYLASGPTAMAPLPVGVHTVTLKITTSEGAVDTDDVVITIEDAAAGLDGDCDGDGDVDLDDFMILKQNFGRTNVTGGAAEGDLDGDGDVDLDDFAILKQNFGR